LLFTAGLPGRLARLVDGNSELRISTLGASKVF
jgi:hypothetical protein